MTLTFMVAGAGFKWILWGRMENELFKYGYHNLNKTLTFEQSSHLQRRWENVCTFETIKEINSAGSGDCRKSWKCRC